MTHPFQTPALRVTGMHGLGDNLHQRAVVRALLAKGISVWLESPWPCLYHDLVGPNLRITGGTSPLRTQAKNAKRERRKFDHSRPPASARRTPALQVHYPPRLVREQGSVLKAMLKACRLDTASVDFRLPVPDGWLNRADAWIERWSPDKPILIYRPLTERREWGGNAARNPDPEAYNAIFRAIRKRYFVVSVADLQTDAEWLVDPDGVEADVVLHRGQLNVEVLAALFKRAALVFTAPGFAVVLAQAVGAPHVAVFGGYEDATSFSAGVRFAPQLALEPIKPCNCFSHVHACDKRMDVPLAVARLEAFLGALSCSI